MNKETYEAVRIQALEMYKRAHIVLTPTEQENLEIADFGLNDLIHTGLQLVTYVNTTRCCAKEMALLPGQVCPEHRHAPMKGTDYIGKEETFRVRYGVCYLYVDGAPTKDPIGTPPEGSIQWYTAWHQIVLHPGEQYTIYPDTRHWFQAGSDGAVISEFSTTSYDAYDIFTDPRIQRMPVVEG